MFLVAGIDPFGTVSAEEVAVENQTALALDDRYALFLGAAGVDRAFEDHDRAGSDDFSDGFAGAVKRSQIGLLVTVDRSRDRYNENIPVAHLLRIGCIAQTDSGGKILRRGFQRNILPAPQHVEPLLLDVKADGVKALSELHGKRQSDISESDQRKPDRSVLNFIQHHFLPIAFFLFI